MSILTALMLVVIVLFLVLYRTMKPKGVFLTAVRTTEEEAELQEAVNYSRDCDKVVLLEHTEASEMETNFIEPVGEDIEDSDDSDIAPLLQAN